MDSKREDSPDLISESPWLPRVNVAQERDALATRCQSYSPVASPWVVKNNHKPLIRSNSNFLQNWQHEELSFKSPVIFVKTIFNLRAVGMLKDTTLLIQNWLVFIIVFL